MVEKDTTKKQVPKGAVIFKQGDTSKCMYDILRGQVGIYADYGTDKEKQLTTLNVGDFFGEMGMIEGDLRSATAVALENDTLLEVITPERFVQYFKHKPDVVLDIMQNMSHRIRMLTRDYLDACRAVTEAEESTRRGGEKSSWLKANMKRFAEDYRAGQRYINESGSFDSSRR